MLAFSEKYGMGYIPAMLERGWETPGKMFDELGSIFEQNRKLFILGEAADVERLRHKLSFLDVPIDFLAIPANKLLNDPAELERISTLTSSGYTSVVTYQGAGMSEAITLALIRLGRHYLNVNLFYELDFCGFSPKSGDFCGIFSVYTDGKVYLKHQNMLVTTICNLNCEYCLNYNPYNKHQKHFDLEELKRNVNTYFSHIDRVGLFQLTGGEPSLYPDLQELILYIAHNFGNKIDKFTLITNGTVVFSDDFCEMLKENEVFVEIDDYSEAVPRLEQNINQLRDKLGRIGTGFVIYPKLRKFLQSFPPLRRNMKMTEDELKEKYRICTDTWQNLRNGRLCSCTYFAFAVNAGLISDDDAEWFDMGEMSDNILSKKMLIEFRCGFNLKGYTNWCRYCNGLEAFNTNYAPGAEQVKGRLEWDINNPTYLD